MLNQTQQIEVNGFFNLKQKAIQVTGRYVNVYTKHINYMSL